MSRKLTATAGIAVDATPARVWQALVDPSEIKQYMFGTEAVSDWRKGSDITFSGVWNGNPYTDKGKIIDILPGKLLHITYYSPLSGHPDVPENYAHVRYELSSENGKTRLTVSQDNIEHETMQKQMIQNWGMVLENLKNMIEQNQTTN